MRRVFTVLLVLFALVAAPVEAGREAGEVFSGSYDWKDGGSDELTAEFRPTGDGKWKVSFEFRFSGKRNKWKGAATGSLDDGGKISGTAKWSGRNWEFEGSVDGGVLRGSHTEILGGGKRYDTGTFELRR